MDRNTITGLVVIALILIGYSYFMSPSKEELKAMQFVIRSLRGSMKEEAALIIENILSMIAGIEHR